MTKAAIGTEFNRLDATCGIARNPLADEKSLGVDPRFPAGYWRLIHASLAAARMHASATEYVGWIG